MAGTKVRVLIVDGSATVRAVLARILASDPTIEVVGSTSDPAVAHEQLVALRPDVIALDVETPRMDGLTLLDELMTHYPVPVVALASLTSEGGDLAMRALALGAVEVMGKPKGHLASGLGEIALQIIDKVKAAAVARIAAAVPPPPAARSIVTPDCPETPNKILALGAGTGGPHALRAIFAQVPSDIPGTLIVQHMPVAFTTSFARSLDETSACAVREAQDGDAIQPGLALLAPGGKHMVLARSGTRYIVRLTDGPLLCRQRPAVDALFKSVARLAGPDATTALLTGMGNDGADGMRELHDAGAHTIAQDQATSVVYGMPCEALRLGAIDKQLPLDEIAAAMLHATAVGA